MLKQRTAQALRALANRLDKQSPTVLQPITVHVDGGQIARRMIREWDQQANRRAWSA